MSEVWIRGNNALTTVSLPGLVQVWKNFQVDNHPALTSIVASNLTTVGAGTGPSSTTGHLNVSGNALLASASFPVLATLDGHLWASTTGLINLNGFSALRSPVYQVIVTANPALTDISGLSGIGATFANPAVVNGFSIQNNTSLCTDHVASLIAAIQARGAGAFANPPVNSGNKSCSAQQEN
ncbi:MAG: hypothetical protein Q8N53_06070 [Longimicrobiales bacterium]|nr:hypothetical protein [Longimicrobiales bacterium]